MRILVVCCSCVLFCLVTAICNSCIPVHAAPAAGIGPNDEEVGPSARGEAAPPRHRFLSTGEKEDVSLAYVWLDIAEEATARNVDRYSARPTVIARTLAIWATSVYDAWAAYDSKAVGLRSGSSLRRPQVEHTLKNKETAISYASYHSLMFAYPESKEWLTEQMQMLGYDPNSGLGISKGDTADPEKANQLQAVRVGILAAKAEIDFRRNDGANQMGNEAGSDGTPYSDYTYYQSVNTPDHIIDPDRWQPIEFTLADGTKVIPNFLTPHWYRVKPSILESSRQFRPGPPPKTTTDNTTLREQTEMVLKYNISLTNEQKAVVEFMRDGPRSTGQSGHWLRFAQDVSRRDHHDLDTDVKLYFAIANVASDAFISCWETKRFYDSSRPWTLVRHYYKGQTIKGWAGPVGGVVDMPAENWHPYSPYSFITPPFPGYTSGHATVSGACSKLLELFTGSDVYGFVEIRKHCELTELNPGEELTLSLPTWSATAEMAALSRALGGYHIPIDNEVGLKVGREIAIWSWPKLKACFDGTATVRE